MTTALVALTNTEARTQHVLHESRDHREATVPPNDNCWIQVKSPLPTAQLTIPDYWSRRYAASQLVATTNAGKVLSKAMRDAVCDHLVPTTEPMAKTVSVTEKRLDDLAVPAWRKASRQDDLPDCRLGRMPPKEWLVVVVVTS